MNTQISLKPLAAGRMVGERSKAGGVRTQVEQAILAGHEVVLDFAGVEVTQSFADELVGVLILNLGPEVLETLVFKNCSENVRAIVQFVAADRADQFAKQPH